MWATRQVVQGGIPGPQMRGTGGTLNEIESLLRSGPPAALIDIPGSQSIIPLDLFQGRNGGSRMRIVTAHHLKRWAETLPLDAEAETAELIRSLVGRKKSLLLK